MRAKKNKSTRKAVPTEEVDNGINISKERIRFN